MKGIKIMAIIMRVRRLLILKKTNNEYRTKNKILEEERFVPSRGRPQGSPLLSLIIFFQTFVADSDKPR